MTKPDDVTAIFIVIPADEGNQVVRLLRELEYGDSRTDPTTLVRADGSWASISPYPRLGVTPTGDGSRPSPGLPMASEPPP